MKNPKCAFKWRRRRVIPLPLKLWPYGGIEMNVLLLLYPEIFMEITSLWRRLYLEQSVQCFAHQFSCASRKVSDDTASYKKNEQVQQANVFKRQHYCFVFFSVLSKFIWQIFIPAINMPIRSHERTDCCTRCMTAMFFVVNNPFLTVSKLLTPTQRHFFHLPRSIASSLFKLHAWQYTVS